MIDLGGIGTFAGFKIMTSLAMVDTVEDWSGVRSPGRARRRRKKHRQNIKYRTIPKRTFIVDEKNHTIHCHPEMARELRRQIKEMETKKL